MISVQIKNKPEKEKYPRLMASKESNKQGFIVLAYDAVKGVVINQGNSTVKVGFIISTYGLVDFEGLVTLSNKD